MRRARAAWLVAGVAALAFAVAQAPVGEGGDALAAGLVPPTAARFADPAWYDLLALGWGSTDEGRTLDLELGAIDAERPLLQPIVEAYLLSRDATAHVLLPGTDLEVPDGYGWRVALRVTEAGAWAWNADAEVVEPQPLEALVAGRTVRLVWPDDLPSEGTWVAIAGVYDPFAENGWRPIGVEPSPWAFAAPTAVPPVVSVLPGGGEALERLHATQALPTPAAAAVRGPISRWWWWMGAGMALAVAGLVWRGARAPAPAPTDHDRAAEARDAVDAGTSADDAEPDTDGAVPSAPHPEATPVDADPSRADAPDRPPPEGGAPALIADADVADRFDGALPSAPEGAAPQVEDAASPPAPARPEAGAPTGSAATEGDDDASSPRASSSRTMRAPSDASRSAKRS